MDSVAKIDPRYSIGIDDMDAQHARWIKLIEEFRAAASGHMQDQAGLRAAERALRAMLDYTRLHFASEEKFLEARGYPGLEAHRQRHGELVIEVVKLLDEILAHESKSTPLKLNLFVTVWLFEHIMDEDIKYARHILGRKPAGSAG